MLPKRTIPGQRPPRFADGLHRPVGLIFASGHLLFTACQLSGQLGGECLVLQICTMLKQSQGQTQSLQIPSPNAILSSKCKSLRARMLQMSFILHQEQ